MPLESPEAIVEAVRAHGWQQGDILPVAAHADIASALGREPDPQQACIVITHSCDLDRPDPTIDVEIVLATLTGKPLDGNFAYARSRKKLQIAIAVTGIKCIVEVLAADRFDVPLAVLGRHAPDSARSLADGDQREILIEWLVARYARPGLPNAFESRIRPRAGRFRKAAKKLTWVWRIYVGLSAWHDLSDDEPYDVELLCVMRAEDYADIVKRQETQDAVNAFLGVLGQCPGVRVSQDAQEVLLPEDEVTLFEERRMRRWARFDYISFEDSGHGGNAG